MKKRDTNENISRFHESILSQFSSCMVSNFLVFYILVSIRNPAVSVSAYILFVFQQVKLFSQSFSEGSFQFRNPDYRRLQLFCCNCPVLILGNYLGKVK